MRFTRFLHFSTLLLQFVLALLTGVYVFLTWGLLQQSVSQLALLRQQHRVTLTPYVVTYILDVDDAEEKLRIDSDASLSVAQKKEAYDRIADDPIQYSCGVTNATSNIAHHLNAVLFDASTQSFLIARRGKETLGQGEQEDFTFGREYSNHQQVMTIFESAYGAQSEFCSELLPLSGTSYIAIVFRDIEERMYLYLRPFEFTEAGGIDYGAGRLFPDPNDP